MKTNKNKLSILIVILVLALVLFSGCSLFKISNLTNTTKLGTPNFELSSDKTYISWQAIPNATKYEIYINGEKQGAVKDTKYYFYDIDGQIDVGVKAVSSSSKFTASELSLQQATVISRLKVTGIQHAVTQSEFIIFWEDVNYRLHYLIDLYEDDTKTESYESYEPSLILQKYDSEIQYKVKIKIFADDSQKRADSDIFEYVIQKNAAVSIPISLEYDKNTGVAPTIDNFSPSIQKVYLQINSKTDITKNCTITEQTIEIKASYLDTLPMGVYLGEFDLGSKKFVLVVKDTREVVLENITFVKNSDYAYVGVEVYSNTITSIEIAHTSVQTTYDYVNKRIIIMGDFLDTLEEDLYVLRVVYGQENILKDATSTVNVKSKPAAIAENARYNYYGNVSLVINYYQQGDSVESLTLDEYGAVEEEYYQLSKNAITLQKEFLLARGNGNFEYCIHTAKGSALLFTIITDIRSFAVQYSNYTYDKDNASGEDMLIQAIINDVADFGALYGALITQEDYTIDITQGIIIDKDFVDNLSVGEYEFLCLSGEGVAQYFTLEVVKSSLNPYNVRLDYDIDPEYVYLTFDCDCTLGHTYRLNGGGVKTVSSRKVKLEDFDKTRENTLRLECPRGGSTTIVRSAPSSTELTYLNERYVFEGENRDKVIENQEQFNHLIRYMALRGYDYSKVTEDAPYSYVEETVFLTQQFLNSDDPQKLLQNALDDFVSPWGYGVLLSMPLSNVFTIKLTYVQKPIYDVVTEYQLVQSLDSRELLVEGNRLSSYENFFIERQTKVQFIRNSSELIELPLGVKPIFANNSEESLLYETAKDICRTYISDNMDDYEKVAVFYYWLTKNVTYDSDALTIYNVINNVLVTSTLSEATNHITAFLMLYPQYNDLLGKVRDINDLAVMKKEANNLLKSMRVFAAEGALLDQKAVCNGIANALSLLCKIEGIDCIRVSGTATTENQTENHAWNKVKIEGKWYIVDATWGRASTFVTHKYLFVTDYSIFNTHKEQQKHSGARNIEYVATGNVDYYSTIIVGEYDLTIDSQEELNAVVAALYASGIRTIELKYNLEGDFDTAFQASLSGRYGGEYQRLRIDDIYIIHLNQ